MTAATHFVQGTQQDGTVVFYTGGAGDNFISTDKSRAFVGWYESGAVAVAARLNRMTAFHGVTFSAMPEVQTAAA